jgi:hypothetical protein
MKYEEVFLEIRYFKPQEKNLNNLPQNQIESIKKIATYKLSF